MSVELTRALVCVCVCVCVSVWVWSSDASVAPNAADIAALVEMGFAEDDVVKALRKAGNKEDAALLLLNVRDVFLVSIHLPHVWEPEQFRWCALAPQLWSISRVRG